jgi:hypothetical protein
METAVTKLEEEMVSLHFQLIQERNERRLVEYWLKHMLSPACSCHSRKLELEVRNFSSFVLDYKIFLGLLAEYMILEIVTHQIHLPF